MFDEVFYIILKSKITTFMSHGDNVYNSWYTRANITSETLKTRTTGKQLRTVHKIFYTILKLPINYKIYILNIL